MRAGVGLAVALVAGLLGAVIALLASGADLVPDGNGPGATAQVAGATPMGSVAAPTDGPRSADGTFDDLVIDAAPPDPWRLEGDGTAGVIALPTSVDRSLRLAAASTAASFAACLPLATAGREASGLSVEVLLGGWAGGPAGLAASPLLELRSGAAVVFALGIGEGRWGETGAIREPAASVVGPERWMALTVGWGSGRGDVRWIAVEGDRQLASGTGEVAGSPPDMACFVAPAGGTPWVALDDVRLEQ